jgi:hypothetical protein
MPHNNSDRSIYQVSDFRERREGRFWLLHLTESGRSYSVSDSGMAILRLLSLGFSDVQVAEAIAGLTHRRRRDALSTVRAFVADLRRESILDPCNVVVTTMSDSSCAPKIEPLDALDLPGRQCLTFGMPKRACKALPSGLTGKSSRAGFRQRDVRGV